MLNDKIGIFIATAGLLAACSTNGSLYRGNSTTYDGNNILRNDVTQFIRKLERMAHNCRNLQAIDVSILSVNQNEKTGLLNIRESWQVTACNQVHTYPVTLRQSADGGTDYTVTYKP